MLIPSEFDPKMFSFWVIRYHDGYIKKFYFFLTFSEKDFVYLYDRVRRKCSMFLKLILSVRVIPLVNLTIILVYYFYKGFFFSLPLKEI